MGEEMELSVALSSRNWHKDSQDMPVRAHAHCKRFHSMSVLTVFVLSEYNNILYLMSDEAAAT